MFFYCPFCTDAELYENPEHTIPKTYRQSMQTLRKRTSCDHSPVDQEVSAACFKPCDCAAFRPGLVERRGATRLLPPSARASLVPARGGRRSLGGAPPRALARAKRQLLRRTLSFPRDSARAVGSVSQAAATATQAVSGPLVPPRAACSAGRSVACLD